LSLYGKTTAGQPALRLRWLSEEFPPHSAGRVVASRNDLLNGFLPGFDLLGLPDPLEKLPERLNETITGTRSIIHGDLNLENVLVGPGGMVWLIDFANTREGHPLVDFAHLETEIIAHVIAPQVPDGDTFLRMIKAQSALDKLQIDQAETESRQSVMQRLPSLLSTIHEIASKCLANPSQPREYWLALYVSCLGALKYRNLDEHQKYLLYLTAAYLAQDL